jgi:hypothetical protein
MDYSKLTEEEKIELFNLRKVEHTPGNYIFKLEKGPGVVVYKNIIIGKKYIINNPSHNGINGRLVEVLNFVYKKNQNEYVDTPIGVQLKFMSNNKKGTYYNIIDLAEA